ncbi:E2/UBC family protein [Kitasatospora sp. NPDC008050]|uniref:E2/UBC family protein n=1 Tax=Kitasatospora sp. NPDC008050 TaxID=3364021 RepID=UPI0036E6CEF9
MAADLTAAGRRRSRLQAEVQLIAQHYREVNFDTKDASWLHVGRFPVPRGWNRPHVEILIDVPHGNPGYPSVAPQWFWTDRDLRTSDGRSIQHFFTSADYSLADQSYLDKGWGHFCIHVTSWHSSNGLRLREGHTLLSYLDLIAAVFRDRKRLAGA